MNEAAITFAQTQKERKQSAAGARARKRGSKSKRCSLPSDNLTPAQRAKLNGPCETINLKRPMTYEELKTYSPSLQSLYLNHLVDDLGARRMDLQDMLGCGQYALQKLLGSLPDKLNFTKGRPLATKKWLAFIGKEPIPEEVIVPSTIPEPEPEKVDTTPPPKPIPIQAGSFTITGSLLDLAAVITQFIHDPDETYTFTLSFTK